MKTIKPNISSQSYHKINLNYMHRGILKIKHHKNHPERLKRIRKWKMKWKILLPELKDIMSNRTKTKEHTINFFSTWKNTDEPLCTLSQKPILK
ncbi:hypothetical protein JT359_10715 [Candidatus Poribacteria bacterium]|nr:hypothetical protein [Candidatus Poribacteria bacterium]